MGKTGLKYSWATAAVFATVVVVTATVSPLPLPLRAPSRAAVNPARGAAVRRPLLWRRRQQRGPLGNVPPGGAARKPSENTRFAWAAQTSQERQIDLAQDRLIDVT